MDDIESQFQSTPQPRNKTMQSPQRTVEVQKVSISPETPGQLTRELRKAKLYEKLQKIDNQGDGTFEEELADGARAAGQTGRIIVTNANPFSGPVRAYAYIAIIFTTVTLSLAGLNALGYLGSKVSNNVQFQVRWGENAETGRPSRLTNNGGGQPPVVDWVPRR